MSHVKIKDGAISPEKSWKGFNLIELILRQRKAIQAWILAIMAILMPNQELAVVLSEGIAVIVIYLMIEALRFYYNKVE